MSLSALWTSHTRSRSEMSDSPGRLLESLFETATLKSEPLPEPRQGLELGIAEPLY
ncbi:hypothetical protein [Pantanalinema sp. GBBB05]|uniref:hypothetical protein n=1 Tax=Pantanalinema sp. GBBB05 TaxID=2604139 RepID=UPI003D81C3E4